MSSSFAYICQTLDFMHNTPAAITHPMDIRGLLAPAPARGQWKRAEPSGGRGISQLNCPKGWIPRYATSHRTVKSVLPQLLSVFFSGTEAKNRAINRRGQLVNAFDAAVQVLTEAQQPLHVTEITARIIEAGLWKTRGKTPVATVKAILYTDIKSRGDNSPFVKVAPQAFALRDSASAVQDKEPPLPSVSATAGISFTNCAQKVLEELGGGQPMHYREITKQALAKGWLVSEGKTPEASMYAQVITEIKRQHNRGEQPRFVQHGRGQFGLSRWMGRGLAFQIEQQNDRTRKALRNRLLAMQPEEFEELASQLLAEIGFESVAVTKRSRDGGIDVRGTLVVGDVVRIKMAVQVKKWKLRNNIQSPIVQQVRGSLGAQEQGLIITTSNFSKGAVSEAAQADKTPIALMDGEQFVALLMEHNIGVERTSLDLFEIDEAFAAGGTGKND